MSKRENRRYLHEKEERQIRSMIRKINQIHALKRNAEVVKLDSPRFWGYRRFFVVRADILRGPDGSFYSNLLSKLQEVWYSKDKSFEHPMIRHNSFFGYIWRMDNEEQTPKKLSEEQWKALSSREQEEFIKVIHFHKYTNDIYYRWVFRYPWKFELKTKKYFITKEQRYDSSLDAEERKLSHLLWGVGLSNKLDHPSRNKDWDKQYKRQKFTVSGID